MLLVVGLGNPGRGHEGQRHNVGFEAVDTLVREEGWPEPRPRFAGLYTRGELAGQPVAVLKPQTYMNLSGESVQPAAAFLKVEPPQVIVVHDELDLAWKDLRLKAGGGHAGHNGLRSLIQHLGSPDFVRVRVGIGRPPPGREVHGWVLSGFDPVERAELAEVVRRAVDAVRRVAKDGLAEAMKAVNTKG
ncbi:MAG TPA: aminoacyl-tRNA hydrolase [Polyangiaceae bacterium]